MSLFDELQKLEHLRQNGTLTDDEFSKAKALLLATPVPTSAVDLGAVVENQLTHLRNLNDLERIDREWQIERQRYELAGPYGRKYIPIPSDGIFIAVLGTVCGLAWIAIAVKGATLISPPFAEMGSVVSRLFVVIGLFVTLRSMVKGHSQFIVARNFQTAYRSYRRHRERAVDNLDSPVLPAIPISPDSLFKRGTSFGHAMND